VCVQTPIIQLLHNFVIYIKNNYNYVLQLNTSVDIPQHSSSGTIIQDNVFSLDTDFGYYDSTLSPIIQQNPMVETETDIFLKIYNNLHSFSLPTYYSYQKMINGNMNVVAFSSFLFSDHLQMVVPYKQIILHSNFNIEVIVVGKKYATYSSTIKSTEVLSKTIMNIEKQSVCKGFNNILLSSVSTSPYTKDIFGTVRHTKCSLLLDNVSETENTLCSFCKRIKTNERQKSYRKSVSRSENLIKYKKRINMQVSPHSKSKLLSLRKSIYNCRKKQNSEENRLKLLEYELHDCKNKIKNIDSFNDQNLPVL